MMFAQNRLANFAGNGLEYESDSFCVEGTLLKRFLKDGAAFLAIPATGELVVKRGLFRNKKKKYKK